jgi:hypothetical protein
MAHENEPVVPPSVVLAAKRGFVRTTAQTYAATIPSGGVSAVVLAQFAADPWAFALVALGALISPPLAGLASYLSIIGDGVPAEYKVAG